ncbi:hypothetical protein C8T65DRAFT_701371 [Cerioporus squamosus]|nr:hypothetical protein C8T65DRAFT_701371 [Cerioporus squamosus]
MADPVDRTPRAPNEPHLLDMLEPSPPRPPSVPLNQAMASDNARTTGYDHHGVQSLLSLPKIPEGPGVLQPHTVAVPQPYSPFEPRGDPSARMGNAFSNLMHAAGDDKPVSPTPPPRSTFTLGETPKKTQSSMNFGPSTPFPAASLAYGKQPFKCQRALSSPSPPRNLLANQYPAREHPGTILTTGPEGSTLADSLYGPQTAGATMDQRQLKPQLVSSREYNNRVHWKAATIYRNSTGVETFEYPKLVPGESCVDPPPSPFPPGHEHGDQAAYPHPPTTRTDANPVAAPLNELSFTQGSAISPETWQSLIQDDDVMIDAGSADAQGAYNTGNRPQTSSARSLFPAGFPMAGFFRSTNPTSAPEAPPAFPLQKWNLVEAERAVQNTPAHPYRRCIKSPAPERSRQLFRTDYYQDMKQYPQLDPLQPAANQAVARTRTQLAQEMLPTTHVPPPPRPFPAEFSPQISWQAMSAVNARPPVDEDSMMRMPPEGGPRIHSDSARGPFRGLAKARVDYILSLPKERTIKYTVWGFPSTTSDPIDVLYGYAQGLISRFLKGATNFRIIAPEGEWGRKVAPNSLNAPGMWIVTELTPAQATALADQQCLSTPEITLFCSRTALENPQFLLRAGQFISKDPELILDTIRNAFVEPVMRARITALLRQNPNYAGMDAEQAFLRFLTTIEMDIKETRTGGLFPKTEIVVSVYCDPPTTNPERWLEWAREFRAVKLQHPTFLNSAVVLPPIRCAGCHSVDHYLDQCEWPEMSDWRAPLPNSSTASSVFDWNTYSRASSSADRAGPSTNRHNDDPHGNRRGGRGGRATPNQGGNRGFGRGFGRDQERTKTITHNYVAPEHRRP